MKNVLQDSNTNLLMVDHIRLVFLAIVMGMRTSVIQPQVSEYSTDFFNIQDANIYVNYVSNGNIFNSMFFFIFQDFVFANITQLVAIASFVQKGSMVTP